MKTWIAFLKKEYLEAARTGRLLLLLLLSALFGIMNPALAKLTPWMMKTFADSLAESGILVTEVSVDAMTSWTQFFKNAPIALIAFVLLFGDTFTREYRSGTLLLVLTRGLSRRRVVLAKTILLLSLWTLSYGTCFGITYGYNAWFWDNGIARHLFAAAAIWWLFGVWLACLIVLFSTLLRDGTGVSLCTGGTVLAAYLLNLLPTAKAYSPALLMDAFSLLNGSQGTEAFGKAVAVTAALCAACIAVSIPVMDKRQL